MVVWVVFVVDLTSYPSSVFLCPTPPIGKGGAGKMLSVRVIVAWSVMLGCWASSASIDFVLNAG